VGAPAPDVGTIQSKIQSFVTAYNATVDLLRSKVNQQRVAVPQNDSDRVQGVLEGDDTLLRVLAASAAPCRTSSRGDPARCRLSRRPALSTGAAVGGGTLNQDALAGKLTLDNAKALERAERDINDVRGVVREPDGLVRHRGRSHSASQTSSPAVHA